MRPLLLWLALLAAVPAARADWRLALPGWQYAFPRDHRDHPDFKTEWWYFTGNLTAADGREFGFQLTFFRQGVRPPDQDLIPLSRFVTRDLKLAHFALTDLATGKFSYFQKISRGAYGEAGFDDGPRLAWNDDWSVEWLGEDAFRLRAKADGVALDLTARAAKPPVIHGTNGVSAKAAGEGRASHYYSFTRLATQGEIVLGGTRLPVTGQTWFDHEWATNQLAPGQVGWDWLSLQFDDGSELMLFQIRREAGGRDEHSSGTFIDAKGGVTPIADADFTLQPTGTWKSPHSGAEYPVAWNVTIPRLNFLAEVHAAQPDQELRLSPVSYWEGAVRATGTRAGKLLTGKGYLELTGYAGRVVGLQANP